MDSILDNSCLKVECPIQRVIPCQEGLKQQRQQTLCDQVVLGCIVGRDLVRQDKQQSLQIEGECIIVRLQQTTMQKVEIKCRKFKSKDK